MRSPELGMIAITRGPDVEKRYSSAPSSLFPATSRTLRLRLKVQVTPELRGVANSRTQFFVSAHRVVYLRAFGDSELLGFAEF